MSVPANNLQIIIKNSRFKTLLATEIVLRNQRQHRANTTQTGGSRILIDHINWTVKQF